MLDSPGKTALKCESRAKQHQFLNTMAERLPVLEKNPVPHLVRGLR
jgi:hypothetical protein